MKSLAQSIQSTLIHRKQMDTFHDLLTFANDLMQRENMVKHRVQKTIRSKIFFRWFDGYFNRLEDTYKTYTRNMKIKVFKGLIMEKRHRRVQNEMAHTKLKLNY